MLPTITLTCPVDGLSFALKTTDAKGDIVKNGEIGGHLHLSVGGTVSCLNGHVWKVSAISMERIE